MQRLNINALSSPESNQIWRKLQSLSDVEKIRVLNCLYGKFELYPEFSDTIKLVMDYVENTTIKINQN